MISKNIAIFEPSAIKLSSTPTSLNEPFFIEISQPLHVMLNSLTRIQEATMKSLSTASWMEVQPKFTNPAAISKMTAASENKPLVFEKVDNKRQSNEEYFQHLAEETLSRVLQLEVRLERTLTIFDLYNHFSKEELDLVGWDAILVYYPDIYSETGILEDQDEEVRVETDEVLVY